MTQKLQVCPDIDIAKVVATEDKRLIGPKRMAVLNLLAAFLDADHTVEREQLHVLRESGIGEQHQRATNVRVAVRLHFASEIQRMFER